VGTGLKAAVAQRLLDRTQEDMQRLERKTLFFQEHSGSAKFLCHEIDHQPMYQLRKDSIRSGILI
jgi:hypothetical protein